MATARPRDRASAQVDEVVLPAIEHDRSTAPFRSGAARCASLGCSSRPTAGTASRPEHTGRTSVPSARLQGGRPARTRGPRGPDRRGCLRRRGHRRPAASWRQGTGICTLASGPRAPRSRAASPGHRGYSRSRSPSPGPRGAASRSRGRPCSQGHRWARSSRRATPGRRRPSGTGCSPRPRSRPCRPASACRQRASSTDRAGVGAAAPRSSRCCSPGHRSPSNVSLA